MLGNVFGAVRRQARGEGERRQDQGEGERRRGRGEAERRQCRREWSGAWGQNDNEEASMQI